MGEKLPMSDKLIKLGKERDRAKEAWQKSLEIVSINEQKYNEAAAKYEEREKQEMYEFIVKHGLDFTGLAELLSTKEVEKSSKSVSKPGAVSASQEEETQISIEQEDTYEDQQDRKKA